MTTHAPLYPVVLELDGRKCLVVGGGSVAARKVAGLVECGARVTVVAPTLAPALERLATTAGGPGGPAGSGGPTRDRRVTVERRPYRQGEAAGYRLVVAATGVHDVNRAVAEDAESAGVWVNSADDAENCSFQLPSVHRDGPVTVAVSTAGASPALAMSLKRRIAAVLGPRVGVLAELLDEARRRVHADGRSTEAIDWAVLLDEGPLRDLVAEGRVSEARLLLARATDPAPDSNAAHSLPV